MDKNKKVLLLCKNYKLIINADFIEGDNISIGLVKIYKDFIFNIDLDNSEDVNGAVIVDKAMAKYVNDYFFRKTMQEEITSIKFRKTKNALLEIIDAIIKIYNRYEEDSTRKIYMAKWI